ncbi:MAG: C45 family autoproteolytic acyltransferase/hydrolase [Bacillota bacterium]
MEQETSYPNSGITRDVMQENRGDYRVYSVRGAPFSIGLQMAEHHQGPDGPRLDDLSDQQVQFSRLCLREVDRIHPPVVQELTAWAGACNLPLDEALFYLSVGMTETSRRGRSRRNPSQAESAAGPDHVAPASTANRSCSTVGVITRDGPVVGRNFDLDFRVKVRHLIRTETEGHLPHTGMYDGLVSGRTDGMNDAGLFASLHTVRSRPPERRKPGLFCVHLVRMVLETCKTAREAAERLLSAPHIAPFNYFLADRNEMLVVEAHPVRARVRLPEDGVLACTNHFVHPEMSDLLYTVPANSAARLRFLRQGVLPWAFRASQKQAADAIASLMADHTVPVCWHTKVMSTLWSAVAGPAAGYLRYALGAPCRTEFSTLEEASK